MMLREKLRKFKKDISNNSEAVASVKQAFMAQMFSFLGTKVYGRVSEKTGRRAILECEEDGVSLRFEEDGKDTRPGFIG